VAVDVLVSMLTAQEEAVLGLSDEPNAAVRAGLRYIACPTADPWRACHWQERSVQRRVRTVDHA
jgi:hypothetical protein